MTTYIITVKYNPKSMFDNGKIKFKVNAPNEERAIKSIQLSSFFPVDGIIIKIDTKRKKCNL